MFSLVWLLLIVACWKKFRWAHTGILCFHRCWIGGNPFAWRSIGRFRTKVVHVSRRAELVARLACWPSTCLEPSFEASIFAFLQPQPACEDHWTIEIWRNNSEKAWRLLECFWRWKVTYSHNFWFISLLTFLRAYGTESVESFLTSKCVICNHSLFSDDLDSKTWTAFSCLHFRDRSVHVPLFLEIHRTYKLNKLLQKVF